MISMPNETPTNNTTCYTGHPELEMSKNHCNHANVTIKTDFINFTGEYIYCKTQRNIPLSFNPEKGLHVPREAYPHLKIVVTYTIHDSKSMEETLAFIDTIINNDYVVPEEAMLLREKIKEKFASANYFDPQNKSVTMAFSRIIRRDDIAKSGTVYIPETNVVVTMDKERAMRPHPYSPEGLQNIEIEKTLANVGQAGVMVKVIDNDQISPVRYFYAAKRLISVRSVVDHRRESGVYLTFTDCDNNRKSSFITFKEAEDVIGLFKTQDEAVTHGDPKYLNEQRERELENANLALKNESMLNKAELQQREAELASLKHDYNVMKEHLDYAATVRKHQINSIDDRRKDYYEERSYYRKDSSEAWKFVPLVVGIVIGVGGIFFGKR